VSDDSPLDPDTEQQIDDLIQQSVASRAKEIKDLGHPEWCVSAFQQLRRLADAIKSSNRRFPPDDIVSRIEGILSKFPEELFSYDEKCLAQLRAAGTELLNGILASESQSISGYERGDDSDVSGI
jgi:hypothetical protein